MPSAKPPEFDGSVFKLAPHECQACVSEYLSLCEHMCQLHGFKTDDDTTEKYSYHLTWVDWIQTGLRDHAFQLWQRIDSHECAKMKWSQFKTWVESNFLSKLAFNKAITLILTLKQLRSVHDYTYQFNGILYSLDNAINDKAICTYFQNGLKPSLRSRPELDVINDLARL
ncbi:hypothetical protein HK405_011162 [Cladochytrium tenue]|nr:hypothetical protein HK405_011162 [Cladochytrium tenue]